MVLGEVTRFNFSNNLTGNFIVASGNDEYIDDDSQDKESTITIGGNNLAVNDGTISYAFLNLANNNVFQIVTFGDDTQGSTSLIVTTNDCIQTEVMNFYWKQNSNNQIEINGTGYNNFPLRSTFFPDLKTIFLCIDENNNSYTLSSTINPAFTVIDRNIFPVSPYTNVINYFLMSSLWWIGINLRNSPKITIRLITSSLSLVKNYNNLK